MVEESNKNRTSTFFLVLGIRRVLNSVNSSWISTANYPVRNDTFLIAEDEVVNDEFTRNQADANEVMHPHPVKVSST